MSSLLTHAQRVLAAERQGRWVNPGMESCPACGEPIDHCRGHGMLGDPCGYAALQRHDEGDHTICHPDGCDQAVTS